jgi:hypothetical protein
MTEPLSPRWRGLRSAIFAVVAALLAALGHAVAGGGFPDAAALLSTAALIGGSVSGLARRRRTAGGIFGVLLASQLAFHLCFVVAGHEHHAVDLTRMVGFHLAAAAIAALVMARGDAALFVLLSWFGRLVPTAGAPIPSPPGGSQCLRPADLDPMVSPALLQPISRRGPPPALG